MKEHIAEGRNVFQRGVTRDIFDLNLDEPAMVDVGCRATAHVHHCGDSLRGIGGERRPGMVHRLDKDTSGVMVGAKDEPSLVALQKLFHDHKLEPRYLAIVTGVVAERGSFKTSYGRDPNDR